MDKEFVISKIKNMYIMLLYAITKEDINRVRHYLSDELYNKYDELIKTNIANNVVQKYGELNVGKVRVVSSDNDFIIANIEAKYIDYLIDRTTREYLLGETKRNKHNVELKIRYNSNNEKLVHRCSNCGAPLNDNLSGVCSYCNVAVTTDESIYVIEEIK